MEVRYRGKIYEVAHHHYLGGMSGLYGLRSRFLGGSIFPARKTDCAPLSKKPYQRSHKAHPI